MFVNSKTVPVNLKKLINVVDNDVDKNRKFNTLKTKVNKLDKRIATTLIHVNQCNIDKQNLKKKIGDVNKKIPDVSELVTVTALNTKIKEVEKKIPDLNGLVKQKSRENTLLLLIILNLWVAYLMQRQIKRISQQIWHF